MLQNKTFKRGFTIVETMLSMAFISMLIVGIAIVTNQVINSYRKGIALKSINQVGQSLSDDLFRAASGTRGARMIPEEDFISKPDYGVMCLGNYSYLWTTGSALVDSSTTRDQLFYQDTATIKNAPIRLTKVRDDSKRYCQLLKTEGLQGINKKISKIDAVELIRPGDGELAINQFEVVNGPFSSQTNQRLSTFIFSIGTFFSEKSISSNAQCLMTDSQAYNCAINKFEITIRINGS